MKRKKEEVSWSEFKTEIIISVAIASILGYKASKFTFDIMSFDNVFISSVSAVIAFLLVTWIITLVVLFIVFLGEFIFEKIFKPKK